MEQTHRLHDDLIVASGKVGDSIVSAAVRFGGESNGTLLVDDLNSAFGTTAFCGSVTWPVKRAVCPRARTGHTEKTDTSSYVTIVATL